MAFFMSSLEKGCIFQAAHEKRKNGLNKER